MTALKSKEAALEVEGVVVDALKDMFRVEISPNLRDEKQQKGSGVFVMAKIAGKLRKHNIRIVTGDKVKIEVSPYDMERGRITYRMK